MSHTTRKKDKSKNIDDETLTAQDEDERGGLFDKGIS